MTCEQQRLFSSLLESQVFFPPQHSPTALWEHSALAQHVKCYSSLPVFGECVCMCMRTCERSRFGGRGDQPSG